MQLNVRIRNMPKDLFTTNQYKYLIINVLNIINTRKINRLSKVGIIKFLKVLLFSEYLF